MKKYNLRFNIWIGIAWTTLVMLAGCVVPVAEETATVQPVTLTPAAASISPSPGATLSPTPSKSPLSESVIPFCTFSVSAAPEETRVSLDDYVFSDPQVVLTHTSSLGIAGWLPDGERLLITRQIPGQPREYVETFNTRTGELRRYGERHSFDAKPLWLATEEVAFADSLAESGTVIRLSRGDEASENVVSESVLPYLTVNPSGDKVLFFAKADQTQPQVLNVTQRQSEALAFELPLTPREELPLGQSSGPDSYRAAWHPAESQIAFYNDTGFYLADLDTQQVCKVDLGEISEWGAFWAFHAQWSPNGRYLAMLITIGDLPLDMLKLAVLDTATGELYSIPLEQYVKSVAHYVTEIAWMPDSKGLVARFVVAQQNGYDREGLYLVDFLSGKARRMLPEIVFGTNNDFTWNLAGSPNGETIATSCPVAGEVRVCLISVTISR